MAKVLGDDPFAGSKPKKPAKGAARPADPEAEPAPAKKAPAKAAAPAKKAPAKAAPAKAPSKKAHARSKAAPAKASKAKKAAQEIPAVQEPAPPPPAAEPILSAAAAAAPEPEPIVSEAAPAPPEPPPAAPEPSVTAVPVSSIPAAAIPVASPEVVPDDAPRPAPSAATPTFLVAPAALPSHDTEPAAAPARGPLSALRALYRGAAMRGRSTQVDDFGLDEISARRADRLLDLLYRRYFRVTLRGVEHIPDGGRALLVANRAGPLPLDGLMLMHGVRAEHPAHRLLRPLVDDQLVHAPFLGPLLARIGAVRACPENAERLLAEEQLVAVFPEGQQGGAKPFRDRYRLQRFGRGGFLRVALRSRAPIIPVAIVGAEEAQPVLGRLPWLGPVGLGPLPSRWYIAFGEPLHLYTDYTPAQADDGPLVHRLAEQVRQKIQEMLHDLLKARRSVIFG